MCRRRGGSEASRASDAPSWESVLDSPSRVRHIRLFGFRGTVGKERKRQLRLMATADAWGRRVDFRRLLMKVSCARCALASCAVFAAGAAFVQYDFTGTLNSVPTPVSGDFSVGDALHVSYVVDAAAALISGAVTNGPGFATCGTSSWSATAAPAPAARLSEDRRRMENARPVVGRALALGCAIVLAPGISSRWRRGFRRSSHGRRTSRSSRRGHA